jgi:hypothetical protein
MMTDQQPSPTMPAGHVIVVVVGALLIGLVFNAADIRRTAERQETGWVRTVGVGLITPIDRVASFFSLDRPRGLVDLATGRAEPASAPTTTTATTAPIAAPESTTTTLPASIRRPVGAADPLTMFIGGDSMVGQFGPMLENRAERSGLVQVTEVIYEFESGLTRPDFVDWPARLTRVMDEQDPEVVVLYFGGNDAQSIQIDGVWVDFDTPEWEAEYRSRVRGVMKQLTDQGRDVYWLGLPIVRSDTFRPRVQVLNEIYASEAADFEYVTYFDAWPIFVGDDGGYSEYLPNAAGDLVDMRLDDGVHYTTNGAILLADAFFPVIAANWDFPPG